MKGMRYVCFIICIWLWLGFCVCLYFIEKMSIVDEMLVDSLIFNGGMVMILDVV